MEESLVIGYLLVVVIITIILAYFIEYKIIQVLRNKYLYYKLEPTLSLKPAEGNTRHKDSIKRRKSSAQIKHEQIPKELSQEINLYFANLLDSLNILDVFRYHMHITKNRITSRFYNNNNINIDSLQDFKLTYEQAIHIVKAIVCLASDIGRFILKTDKIKLIISPKIVIVESGAVFKSRFRLYTISKDLLKYNIVHFVSVVSVIIGEEKFSHNMRMELTIIVDKGKAHAFVTPSTLENILIINSLLKDLEVIGKNDSEHCFN